MKLINTLLFKIVLLIKLTEQVSLPNSLTYTAGVVEFEAKNYGTSMDTVMNRTQTYLSIIQSAEAIDTDIIVFPEATFNTIDMAVEVPRAEYHLAPCDYSNYTQFLRDLSCTARSTKKYLLINLYMKRNCTEDSIYDCDLRNCSPSNINIYNANVVFDRNGIVISIYRKFNLFVEPQINTTVTPDIGIFTTDFGVTFGHFICFDILFRTPAIDLITKYNITDILYPVMWFSQMPFLTAVQVQQGWAERFNVNLLAAGASCPSYGCSGTGIYAGKKGPLISIIQSESKTRLLVATIEKIPNNNSNINNNSIINIVIPNADDKQPDLMSSLILSNREPLENYTVQLLDFKRSKLHSLTIYSTDFACYLNVTVQLQSENTPENYYRYYAVAYKGDRRFVNKFGYGIMACGIIACTNRSRSSCAHRFSDDNNEYFHYKFTSIQILAVYQKAPSPSIDDRQFIVPLPSTLNSNILPLGPTEYEYNEIGNFLNSNDTERKQINMLLKKSQNNLLTFGFYARTYPITGETLIDV